MKYYCGCGEVYAGRPPNKCRYCGGMEYTTDRKFAKRTQRRLWGRLPGGRPKRADAKRLKRQKYLDAATGEGSKPRIVDSNRKWRYLDS